MSAESALSHDGRESTARALDEPVRFTQLAAQNASHRVSDRYHEVVHAGCRSSTASSLREMSTTCPRSSPSNARACAPPAWSSTGRSFTRLMIASRMTIDHAVPCAPSAPVPLTKAIADLHRALATARSVALIRAHRRAVPLRSRLGERRTLPRSTRSVSLAARKETECSARVSAAWSADDRVHPHSDLHGADRDRIRRHDRPPRDRGRRVGMPAQHARSRGNPGTKRCGAIRRLVAIGPPFVEEIIEYERPTRYAYKMLSGAPTRNHIGTIHLCKAGTGTEVSWHLRSTLKIPALGLHPCGPR